MSFRILLRKSAWSCETNMCSAIDQATKPTTRGGGNSRSSSARREDCLRSRSIPRPDTTLPATKSRGLFPKHAGLLAAICCAIALFAAPGFAQIPVPTPTPPPPPGQNTSTDKQGATIISRVNLVVLHTTVLDDRQRFADGLKEQNFRVFEDKVEQKLAVFKREDLPVSMG